MTGAYGIIVCAVVLCLLSAYLRKSGSGFGGVMSLCIVIWLVFIAIDGISYLKNGFESITGKISSYIPYIAKSAGIGFLSQTAADICKDAKEEAVSNKIITVGKLAVLTVCMPLLKNLFDMITGYIK